MGSCSGQGLEDRGFTFDGPTGIKWKRKHGLTATVKVTHAVGCGKPINWSQLPVVDPDTISDMGISKTVEMAGTEFEAVGCQVRPELLEQVEPGGSRTSVPSASSVGAPREVEPTGQQWDDYGDNDGDVDFSAGASPPATKKQKIS